MAGFQNHRCFTLRCLGEKVVPVSIRLKSQVKTPKGLQIIRRTEISLLNERIRSINNTINMLSQERDTCIRRLKEKIKDEGLFQECEKFIEERREARHYKTMSRKKKKLEALCQKSKSNFERGGHSNNMHSGNMHSGINMHSGKNDLPYASNLNQNKRQNKWMINISSKPLTADEEKLLAHGPKYAIILRNPPIVQYVAAVEHACTRLEEGKAEEFRVQVKAAIQKMEKPKPNLTRGERKAISELKKEPSRMVLTMDKGVALVVLNTEDYKKKAEELLNQNTYRALTLDPTMRLKNKMISILKSIKSEGGMTEELYKRFYPIGAGSPKFYGLPKIHKPGMPLRP